MFKEITNIWRRFLSVTGYVFLAVMIAGPVTHIIEEITFVQISWLMIFSVLSALSSLVFISSTELYGIFWWRREIICILINEVAGLIITYYIALWKSVAGGVIIAIIIVIIAFGNHLIEYSIDLRTANQINEKIKEKKTKEKSFDKDGKSLV